MTIPSYVYVASSWRNPRQASVVEAIRQRGIDCYDFRNPGPGDNGFRWTDVDLKQPCRCDHDLTHGFCRGHYEARWAGHDCSCPRPDPSAEEYLEAIDRPAAVDGFDKDFTAMVKADAFVLILPCGRSAHLELGWAVGAGKRTAILLDDPCTPELMYRMVDLVTPRLEHVLDFLTIEVATA